MFSFFRKPDAPVKVGQRADPAPIAEVVDTAQIITIRPRGEAATTPTPATTPTADTIITSLSQVPPYTAILTANVGRAPIRLAKHLETAVMALEVGPKRAAIYYNPAAPANDTAQALAEVRRRLIIDSYDIDLGETRCHESIIIALLEQYKSRAEHSDASTSSSASRRMWEQWGELAWKERASDLHIQLLNNKASVMVRVDGMLEPLPDGHNGVYTATQAEQVIAWAYSDATQTDSNNAGMFSTKANIYSMFKPRVIDGSKIGMRFQSLVGAAGPKIVCRLLNIDVEAPTLTYSQLGYADSHQRLYKEAAENPTGMVLFAGVTGSGKTTTQKTFIETHPDNGSAAFYSIEDPIEYPLRNVHQIPIQRDLSNPEQSEKIFNEVVSGVVRADPDGLLVGEIRDRATASTAQQICETGHLVVGTVHAHLISGIISRLTDKAIGMSREVLTGPNIITLLVYQGLVPLLCRNCCINGSEPDRFHEIHFGGDTIEKVAAGLNSIHEILDTLETKFKLPRILFNFKKSDGCNHCKQRGTKGLTVVAEMIMPDDKWLELTRNKKDYEAVAHYRSFSDGDFRSPDMTGKTVFEHALYKATLGQIDPRRCQNFDTFKRFKILDKDTK